MHIYVFAYKCRRGDINMDQNIRAYIYIFIYTYRYGVHNVAAEL